MSGAPLTNATIGRRLVAAAPFVRSLMRRAQVARLVDGRHHLAVGVEGDLGDARVAASGVFARHRPALAAATTSAPSVGSPTMRQVRLAVFVRGTCSSLASLHSSTPCSSSSVAASVSRRQSGASPREELAFGVVALAGHLELVPAGPARASRSSGSGSACRSCRSRSPSRSPASPPPAACGSSAWRGDHALHAQRQADRDHRRQAFGHGRDGQADGRHEAARRGPSAVRAQVRPDAPAEHHAGIRVADHAVTGR